MKKTKSLLGLAVLVLSAGALVACGEAAESKPAASACKTHKFKDKEVTKAATCTEKGEKIQKCEVCGEEKKVEIKTIAHTMEKVDAESTAATCEAEGKTVNKCKVCGTKEEKTVAALGHEYVDKADQTGAVAAGCTTEGTKLQECSRCHAAHTETVEALGHEWGETTWTTPAACGVAGVGDRECERCHEHEPQEAEPLEHEMVLQTAGTPVEGQAAVNLYTCERECGTSYFGFKASEPSAASREHLVINEETGGARFWGRPIGNDVQLDEEGSPSEDAHEAVFNAEQTGDYFEYIFTLTAAQVAAMGSAQRLYCQAEAAQWMSNNRMDFWACKQGDTDWTRGMYVETTDTHTAGEEIDTYRYILYVDDQVQDFDPTISVPARSNTQKVDYVLPYTFHLHEGVNKIRLVMAGGYRSTFYNFTFRPYVDPNAGQEQGGGSHEHAPTAGAKAADSALRALTCTCANYTGYELQAADVTEGQNAPAESGNGSTEKNTRLGKSNKYDDVWNITGIQAGQYDLYLNARCSAGNANAGYWNSGTAVANGGSASDNGNSTDYKYKVKVGDGEYTPIGNDVDNYAATGLNENTPAWTNKAMARITVPAGATSLTIHNMNNGYAIWVYGARLVKVA